ncbi:protein of unknown function [Candidatus Hydrogenisulfobacillus filiaventi]|uniref:Uncharacterized protein n=1 Tax=Candidatus Hydrogenisulfobacillus filiaventi TaxID=2707344 RepID=A0A6F8ZHE0_9FIRM|nr:hypothetical protein [Bacillota bacterium]CAB1129018.1 protein of unknown function [Candidatus Hydrogenisulfobacillus filiaventi]
MQEAERAVEALRQLWRDLADTPWGGWAPCRVGVAEVGPQRLVWADLGQAEDSWCVRPEEPPAWIRSWPLDPGRGWDSGYRPEALQAFWVGPARWQGDDLVFRTFIEGTVLALLRATRGRDRPPDRWYTWVWPPAPAGVPCPQLAHWGSPRPPVQSREDLDAALAAVRLSAAVPEPVWALLNRAVRLLRAGYYDCELFAPAELYAAMAVETALKAAYLATLDRPAVMTLSDGRRGEPLHARVYPDPPSYATLSRASRDFRGRYRGLALAVNTRPFPLGKGALLNWVAGRGWLDALDVALVRHYFRLRDVMSHPEVPFVETLADALETLEAVVGLLNRFWARVGRVIALSSDAAMLEPEESR